jgi:hypothetical protein
MSERAAKNERRTRAARAIHDAFAEGLLGARARAELTPDWTMVHFAAYFQEALGIGLDLRKSEWGEDEPVHDLELPSAFDSTWYATADERELARRLIDDQVVAALKDIALGAIRVRLHDIGVLFQIHDLARALPLMRTAIGLVESLQMRRRLLPKFDHSGVFARVWREVAETHEAVLDEADEHLTIELAAAKVDVQIRRLERRWTTVATLTFAAPFREPFELSDTAPPGIRRWLTRPFIVAARPLYVTGSRSAARAFLQSDGGTPFVELSRITNALSVSEHGITARIDRILDERRELERFVDRAVEVARSLAPASKRGAQPYR